jgi:hypothetical protein
MRKTLVALMAVGALGVSSAALAGGGHGHGGSMGGVAALPWGGTVVAWAGVAALPWE